MAARIFEADDGFGLTLSFRESEMVKGEEWSKQKLGRIQAAARVEDCNFDGTRAKQVILGGGGYAAEFINCTFDNTCLTFIIGQAKFIKCSFRNARIRDFRVNPVALVNCDFRGAVLRDCQFWGGPTAYTLEKYPDLGGYSPPVTALAKPLVRANLEPV